MNTYVKAILTAACVVALAWPLLFWGKPASTQYSIRQVEKEQPPLPYNIMPRHELLW